MTFLKKSQFPSAQVTCNIVASRFPKGFKYSGLSRVVKYIYHTRLRVVQFEPESYLCKTIIGDSEEA